MAVWSSQEHGRFCSPVGPSLGDQTRPAHARLASRPRDQLHRSTTTRRDGVLQQLVLRRALHRSPCARPHQGAARESQVRHASATGTTRALCVSRPLTSLSHVTSSHGVSRCAVHARRSPCSWTTTLRWAVSHTRGSDARIWGYDGVCSHSCCCWRVLCGLEDSVLPRVGTNRSSTCLPRASLFLGMQPCFGCSMAELIGVLPACATSISEAGEHSGFPTRHELSRGLAVRCRHVPSHSRVDMLGPSLHAIPKWICWARSE